MKLYTFFFVLSAFLSYGQEVQEITFPSEDGLLISANLYEVDPLAPVIVLCHQARFNKFEYDGIAQRLNKLGFNCLAIDQRSGGPIASQQNETNLRAVEQGLPTDYLDAEKDIKSAVSFASHKYNRAVILWGSSYSSTLVLYVALDMQNIEAVISFSPGNYFAEDRGDLVQGLTNLKVPVFITSSKQEADGIEELTVNVTRNDHNVIFKPNGNGHHGSRALWPNQSGAEEYWKEITLFLKKFN